MWASRESSIKNFFLHLSSRALDTTPVGLSVNHRAGGCKTQADGCCLWMASLYDSNCITLNYGWNDPFLGWGYKSGSLKKKTKKILPSLSPSLIFLLPQMYYFTISPWKNNFHPYYPPLGKTNIDSDESANNDGRLFLVVCTQVGVCICDCRVCVCVLGVQGLGSRDVGVKSQLAYSSASEAERSQQGAERSQFRPGERSYPAPIPQKPAEKREGRGQDLGGFNERPEPGMYTLVYLVRLSDLFF